MLGGIIKSVVGSVANNILGGGSSGGTSRQSTTVINPPDYSKFAIAPTTGGGRLNPSARSLGVDIKVAKTVGEPKDVSMKKGDPVLLATKWARFLREMT